MSPQEFLDKVEWEGGVIDALEYGLKSSDIEPVTPADHQLVAAWLHLEQVWAEDMEPAIDKVEVAMDAVEEPA